MRGGVRIGWAFPQVSAALPHAQQVGAQHDPHGGGRASEARRQPIRQRALRGGRSVEHGRQNHVQRGGLGNGRRRDGWEGAARRRPRARRHHRPAAITTVRCAALRGACLVLVWCRVLGLSLVSSFQLYAIAATSPNNRCRSQLRPTLPKLPAFLRCLAAHAALRFDDIPHASVSHALRYPMRFGIPARALRHFPPLHAMHHSPAGTGT